MSAFRVDENLPVEVADAFRQAGHDAASVPEQKLVGSDDSTLAAICSAEGRVPVTLDIDFADIRAYPPIEHAGIVVLRLARHDKRHVLAAVTRLLDTLREKTPDRKLWLVDESRIREHD